MNIAGIRGPTFAIPLLASVLRRPQVTEIMRRGMLWAASSDDSQRVRSDAKET